MQLKCSKPWANVLQSVVILTLSLIFCSVLICGRVKAKLDRAQLRLTRAQTAYARRKRRVKPEDATLHDDTDFKLPSWAQVRHGNDSNFTKGLLQSGHRGQAAYATEKKNSFVYHPLDKEERRMLARDYKPQGEFSTYLNRCINQCYVVRRGIEDPLKPNGDSLAFAKAASRPQYTVTGRKSDYIGLPLDPLVPERYGKIATIGVHDNPKWRKLHNKPMNLAFANDYKRQQEKNLRKGFLSEHTNVGLVGTKRGTRRK